MVSTAGWCVQWYQQLGGVYNGINSWVVCTMVSTAGWCIQWYQQLAGVYIGINSWVVCTMVSTVGWCVQWYQQLAGVYSGINSWVVCTVVSTVGWCVQWYQQLAGVYDGINGWVSFGSRLFRWDQTEPSGLQSPDQPDQRVQDSEISEPKTVALSKPWLNQRRFPMEVRWSWEQH